MLISEGNSTVDGYGYLATSWKQLDTSVAFPSVERGGASGRNGNDPGEAVARGLLGSWYDGGPGCASIKKGDIGRSLSVRLWYCEADENSAIRLAMDYDDTVAAFVHEESGLVLRPIGGNTIRLVSNEKMRSSLGDNVYLTDDNVTYSRQ
jgi:hypothetical protein